MALTRPTAYQINTVSTTITDPLIVLNQGSTAANIDIGFIIDRSPSANVAIVWQASSNQFILANTSSSGTTNANITVSNYANLRAGNILATTLTTTNLVGDANITVTGSMLPSANVTYDLGSPTQRWRSGWFSGSTIHIGNESLSVDNNGKWMFTSDGATIELGKNHDFNPPNANISGNVTATNYLFANGTPLMTLVNTMIGTANTNMQGHMAEQISTANVNLKGYVDGQISTTATSVTTANTNLKGYVDGQITNLVNGSPATLDTLNELAAALGNDANLSVTLTNQISGVQGNVTAANAAIVTANTAMKGYVDANITTVTNSLAGANATMVTSVTGTAPVTSSGGKTPAIGMAAATASVNGYMTSTYASKLDGIAAGATNVTNTNQLTNGAGFITSSGTATNLYGAGASYIASSSSGTGYGSAIQIREAGLAGAQASAIAAAPRLAFHWSGVVASSIVMEASGRIAIVNNPGTSYEAFACGVMTGTATNARYADLAENYSSDKKYVPGTVVVFGGNEEITISTFSHDTAVAGVISTNPAHLMNSELDGLPVALQGRVPCRVQGPINKGELVVTSGIAGVAQRLDRAQYLPGCVIGKALEYITEDRIVTIEVVVGRI